MKQILVTGASGQLGQTLQGLSSKFSDLSFYFTDINELDITKLEDVQNFFKNNSIDWCINCAAYTAVDKAESEQELAKQINVEGIQNLAIASKEKGTKLIHISTDFVFDGNSNKAYTEVDKPNPIGAYASTKAQGEETLKSITSNYFILRTSWLYSEYAQNFVKTMLRLSKEKDCLNVVTDQIGSPTYAGDLGALIIRIIALDSKAFGTYHFCNSGIASWFDVAKAVFDFKKIDIQVNPIKTDSFPTPAKRPVFSVLDTTKTVRTFDFDIPYWRDSLKLALLKL